MSLLLLLGGHGVPVLLAVVVEVGPVPLVHVLLGVGVVGILLIVVLLLLLHGVLLLLLLLLQLVGAVVGGVGLLADQHGVAVGMFDVPQGVLQQQRNRLVKHLTCTQGKLIIM